MSGFYIYHKTKFGTIDFIIFLVLFQFQINAFSALIAYLHAIVSFLQGSMQTSIILCVLKTSITKLEQLQAFKTEKSSSFSTA